VAGPFGSRQLADLGARVIKIERPGTGDFARDYDHAVRGMGSHFIWLNRGKESVELDVKTRSGPRRCAGLTDRVDVVMQNLSPGASRRLGLDADRCGPRRPELIVCEINGLRRGRSLRRAAAYDMARPG